MKRTTDRNPKGRGRPPRWVRKIMRRNDNRMWDMIRGALDNHGVLGTYRQCSRLHRQRPGTKLELRGGPWDWWVGYPEPKQVLLAWTPPAAQLIAPPETEDWPDSEYPEDLE